MNIRKIFQNEPVGLISLAVSFLVIVFPMAWSSFENAFSYSEKFDIRCDDLLASSSELIGVTIVQKASCIIVNNSDSDVSLVGVTSAIFHDTQSYQDLLLPKNLRIEVEPAFLRKGEFYRFKTLYYAPLNLEIILEASKSCFQPDSLQINRHPIVSIKVCDGLKATAKNPLERFYEGLDWEFYTFNRVGLVFHIGNGRDVYFSPSYALDGNMRTKEEMIRSFGSPGFSGLSGSKSQWADPPRFWKDIIPMIILASLFLMIYAGSYFAIQALAKKLARVELQLIDGVEQPTVEDEVKTRAEQGVSSESK